MKKKLLIVILIILGLVSVIGITYAWFTWGVKIKVNGQVNCFDVIYAKGKDIGSNENSSILKPGNSFYDGLSTTVTVKLNTECNIIIGKGILYLNTDEITSDILINTGVLKYQVIDGNNLVTSGVINSKGIVPIYEDFDITHLDKALIVVVWLDSNLIDENNYEEIYSSSYKGSISMKVESR